ncbi:DUF6884 domain-containing protein [Arthrobacter sp. Soil736]|uniref:DUF6884 domain-containing protein n=1 Tax=Arthrobacter sp. Soil736 TaxID=1736395 RepID=UPI00190FEFA7|nr:DUF6884 domain-containing protein [Arthrobacter sp. Soil736]
MSIHTASKPSTSTGVCAIGLVGCASQKLTRPAPARELYVSQLFRKASAYAELTCDRWYVLSAKHGVVHPDEILEPYDMRLGTNHRTTPPIHPWAARVRDQMAVEFAGIENVKLIALAGEQYRTVLLNSQWPSEVPMHGLGIGQQLGWLTAQLATGSHGGPMKVALNVIGGDPARRGCPPRNDLTRAL